MKMTLISICTFTGECKFKVWKKPTFRFKRYFPICKWKYDCNHKLEMSTIELGRSSLYSLGRRDYPFGWKKMVVSVFEPFKRKKREKKNV